MAQIVTNVQERIYQIKRWLGVNEAQEGEASLKMGEAAVMRNFKVTAGGALKKRGEMDNIPELVAFGEKLEQASLKCIEDGFMTKDLALLADMENKTVLSTEGFILKVKEYLDAAL